MSHIKKLVLVPLAVAFLLALSPCASWGQTVYGNIAGTVLDASGAAIPGTAVTLTNLGTAEKRSMQSDAAGNYTFVNILPGNYRIDAEKAGFKHFKREPITVQVESGLRIDITMEVGAVTQTVEVTAQTPLLQPQTSSLGQVVESRTVTEMPLNGRNPLALVQLSPGVVPQGQPSAGNSSMASPVGANPFAAGDFQVGGGQAGQSAMLLDGSPMQGSYLNVVGIIPTQDSIQEFKVQTNNLGPDFGRTAGGVINLTTKGGSNTFHGAAYEYLRNKVLDANDFFLNKAGLPVAPFTQNQFGGNLGGKIITDKLFFFGSYEGFRQRLGQTITGTVPTAKERLGDFSETMDSNGNLIPIYDPTTSANCTNAAGTSCRTPYANNIIPTAQVPGGPKAVDPTAAILATYWANPTTSGDPYTHIHNYAAAMSVGGNTDQNVDRADWNVSDKQRFFGRFSYMTLHNLPWNPFKNGVCPDRCDETVKTKLIAVGDTYTFTPTTIMDLHLSEMRYNYHRTPLSQGIDLTKFGWPASLNSQVTYTHIPVPCVGNSGGVDYQVAWCEPADGTGSGIGAGDDTWSFIGSLTKIKGAHTLKMGGELRVLRNNYYQSNDPVGEYDFGPAMTSRNPLIPGTDPVSKITYGSSFASFMVGAGSGGGLTTPSRMAEQTIYRAVYFGDTWQATRKLTMNLGVRWDIQGTWSERFDRMITFLPDATSPLASQVTMNNPVTGQSFSSLKGAFALVNSTAHPSRNAENMPWTNLNPRFGLAYRLNDKTVLRGGYGIFWLGIDVRWDDAPHNMYNNTFTTPWLVSLDGITPNTFLNNPYGAQGVIEPPGRNATWINQQGGPSGPVPTNPYGYVQQWNLNVQRTLPDGTLIDVAYAGSKGTHLPMHSQGYNQLPTADLPAADGSAGPNGYSLADLKASVPNPFFGLMQSGNISQSTVQAAHMLYPFPQWDGVQISEPDNRDSIYHSMQMKIQKNMKGGGSLLASYTISKLITDTNSELNWLEASAPSWGDTNAYDLHNERSLDGFDVPQRFVLAYILDLPFGKGKKYASGYSGVADKFVSGWGIDGITTFQSGFPLNIGGAGLLGNVPNGGGQRATRTGRTTETSGSPTSRLNEWFNTSVFSPTNTYNSYGADSRTEPNLRAQGQNSWDFAVFKNTKFGPDEKLAIQFRAEFFNIFNHPQFGPPNTGCCQPAQGGGNSAMGSISSQYNFPRIIQFGLKLTF